jgi:hypothetical protein
VLRRGDGEQEETTKMQAETWGHSDDRAAANKTAVIAMERAIKAYRRLGSAATINALADELYAIGYGTEADALTTIAKELWQLADAM